MSPEQIKQLRRTLRCDERDLARAMGTDPKEIEDWETGERFPTQRKVKRLLELERLGPSAIPKAGPRSQAAKSQTSLADPRIWEILRKLLHHPELFAIVHDLAKEYSDPVNDPSR